MRRESQIAGGAGRSDEPLAKRLLDQLLDQKAGQLHQVGEIQDRLRRFGMHELDHQVQEVAVGNPGLLERGRDRRGAVDDGGDLVRRHHAHRDQVLAQSPAIPCLTGKRRLDVDRGD